MPREKEAYRDNVERIKLMFPDKELLSKRDVSRFTGISERSISNKFPFRDNRISVATLARILS